MTEDLKIKIDNFSKADYPKGGKHLSFIECLRTITKDKDFELDKEQMTVKIGSRVFRLVDLYCPDLKEPNAFLWDESARIYLQNEKYIVEYIFDSVADEVSRAYIHEEDEKGYIEICGKKYKTISTLDKKKIKEDGEIIIE